MLAQAKKYAQIEYAFMQEEAPITSTLGGGERMQANWRYSPKREERV